MAALNDYKYPNITAREAVDIADILVNTFGGEPSDRDAFAQEVGHSSAESGAFKMKIADVRRYGLLPSRGLEATELAHRVADSEDSRDNQEALFRMYQNIPLLNRLYNHLGGQTPRRDFWRILTEVTAVEPDEAKEQAADIENLYRQMLRSKPTEDGSHSDQDAETVEEASHRAEAANLPDDGILVTISGDRLVLNSVSEANLEMARLFIVTKKQELSSTSNEGGGENQDVGLGTSPTE